MGSGLRNICMARLQPHEEVIAGSGTSETVTENAKFLNMVKFGISRNSINNGTNNMKKPIP